MCVCVGGGMGVCAPVIAHFRGHVCFVFGDTLQLGTSLVVKTSSPTPTMAKKCKNALL